MDKEQAQFILRSFRPDGADADDDAFAAALKLAAENRELGEWLANERAFDARFAEAIGSVEIPGRLREDILAGLAANRGDLPHARDDFDALMIGSMASVQPPPALRGEILTAMRQTTTVRRPSAALWRRAAMPASVAAGIALAFFLTRGSTPPGGESVVSSTVPVDMVQAGFIRTFESPLFVLDENREQPSELMEHLQERKLPCPKKFPKGLADVKGVGCRELTIDGKRGSLVCFDETENGIVHLVIFRREDVCGDLPCKDHPAISQHGPWAVARWLDGGHVYVLLGSTSVEKLASLF